jgi:hypothetical protein
MVDFSRRRLTATAAVSASRIASPASLSYQAATEARSPPETAVSGRSTAEEVPGHRLGAVPGDERTLLHNLLDSLDRLYDRDCGPVDVDLLLTATASAITDQAWIATIEQALTALGDLIRAKLPAEEEYRQALVVTGDLRIKLADYYKRPPN